MRSEQVATNAPAVRAGWLGRRTAVKVPLVGVVFWVVKLLTTGLGESTSDYLTHTLEPVVAFGIGGVAFAAALAWQLALHRYVAWVYWLAAAMVSVFGTMVADAVHVELGVPYAVSTAVLLVVLGAVFAVWYAVEGTLSIHSIDTGRRELFYWAAVLVTFALGTAAGDLIASVADLGYAAGIVVFAVLIAVPAAAYWRRRIDPVLAFWWAYVLTRPLGASAADWLAAPPDKGGLDLGYGSVSIVLGLLTAGGVAVLALRRPAQVVA